MFTLDACVGCGHVLGLFLEFYLGRAFVVWLSRYFPGTRAGLGCDLDACTCFGHGFEEAVHDTAAARTRAELSHRLCLGPATLRLRGGGDRKMETHILYMTLRPRVPERS